MTKTGSCAATLAALSLIFVTPPASGEWRTTGPYGGDAELVRVVPKVRDLVIAGAHNGLLFTSSNGGLTWLNIPFAGELTGTLHALEVDPRSAGTWYAGMEGDHPWTSGVYKTTDGGKTWKLLPAMKGKAVWSLTLFPANPDVLAAGTEDGVYRSLDGGAAWKHISAPGNEEFRPVVSLAFDPANSDIVYAGTTHLPWRTTDGGASWDPIHTGMIDDSDVFSIQVDAHKRESVYASACSGLYASADGAAHWKQLPTPKGAFRTYFVSLDPRHNGVIFAGTTAGLLRSDDGGKAFRVVSTEAIRSISFDPFVADRIFFASTTAGLMLSTDDGRTLRTSNTGFTNRSFTSLATGLIGTRRALYATSVFDGGSGGVSRSENFGASWERAGVTGSEREIRVISAAPDQPGTLFAAGYHGLVKSKDAGKTWAAMNGPTAAGQFTALAALPHDVLLAGTGQGLYAVRDANSWQAVPIGVPGGIAAIERSGDAVAAVTAHGAAVSTDGGASWSQCGEAAPGATWYRLALDKAPADKPSHTALAATSAGLFRSTDDCKSWTRVKALLPATVNVVVFHPSRSGEAFATQDGGVFRSTDGGQNWEQLGDEGEAKVWPAALVVLPDLPNRVYALFPRRGVSYFAFDPRKVEVAQFPHFASPKL